MHEGRKASFDLFSSSSRRSLFRLWQQQQQCRPGLFLRTDDCFKIIAAVVSYICILGLTSSTKYYGEKSLCLIRYPGRRSRSRCCCRTLSPHICKRHGDKWKLLIFLLLPSTVHFFSFLVHPLCFLLSEAASSTRWEGSST